LKNFTYCDKYDLTELIRLIKQLNNKISYFSFIIKSSSKVLFDYLIDNSSNKVKFQNNNNEIFIKNLIKRFT